MATILTVTVAVVAVVVVGTALGLVRQHRRRIRDLEAELDEVYEVQHLLQEAQARKNRSHLHLLGLVPLAWLARHGRMALAAGTSATLVGVGFTAPDGSVESPLQSTPPAAVEPVAENLAPVDTPVRARGVPPALQFPSTTTTVAAEVPVPPAASADVEGESTSPTVPPLTATSTTSTTTTTLPVELAEILPCLNPQGIPLPLEACP
jgi:hypothetical protein